MIKITMNQKGAFSPFIFGMLFALSAFSTMAAYWAQKDLIDMEKKKVERQKKEAKDLRESLENAILTETTATYSESLTLGRAKSAATLSTGKTRGGSDITLNALQANVALGISNTRVLIATSDDAMLKADVSAVNSIGGQSTYSVANNEAVEFYDSQAARTRQVELSLEQLNAEAAQLYSFYEANTRFPDASEYADINTMTGFKDVWGDDFTYVRSDNKTATLAFTTPWGYTQTINLDMNF